MDILFSDHQLTRASLESLGVVVNTMAHATPDPQLQRAALMTLLSRHPSRLVSAEFPPEAAKLIDEFLGSLELPDAHIELVPQRPGDAGPASRVELSGPTMEFLRPRLQFEDLLPVEVRTCDGAIHRTAMLVSGQSEPYVLITGVDGLEESDLAAVRAARGCLPSLRRRLWFELR